MDHGSNTAVGGEIFWDHRSDFGIHDMFASRHFGGQLTPLTPPPPGCATVDMKWLIDPFRDKPTSISQSEYLSSVRDMTILMAAIDPATPETPGTIANSVLFTLELTRYWSDTAAGTLAVSRPEHLRHSPPPSFALDCQRRSRSAALQHVRTTWRGLSHGQATGPIGMSSV